MTDFELLKDRFPRISNRLTEIWGSKECREELIKLITDTRNGTRQGFPPDIAAAIIRILSMHDAEFPQWNDSFDTPIPFTGNHRPVRDVPVPYSGYQTIVRLASILVGVILFMGLAKFAYTSDLLGMIF